MAVCCNLQNIDSFAPCDAPAEDKWARFIFAKKTAAEILVADLATSVAIAARLASLVTDPDHYIITPELIMGSDFTMDEPSLLESTNTPTGASIPYGYTRPKKISFKMDRLSPTIAKQLIGLNCAGELQVIAIDNANNLVGRYGTSTLAFRGFYGRAFVSEPFAVPTEAFFTRQNMLTFLMTEENWMMGANNVEIATSYALALV